MNLLDGSFLGLDISAGYYKLWDDKKYILRRVHTFTLLDRALLIQNVTIDLNWARVRHLWQIKHQPISAGRDNVGAKSLFSYKGVATKIKELMNRKRGFESGTLEPKVLPILFLRNQAVYDVSARNSEGAAIHLCRREVNQNIAAHIATGLCISRGLKLEYAQEIHEEMLKEIQMHNSDPHNKTRISKALALLRARDLRGKNIERDVGNFLSKFATSYLQCIEFPSVGKGVEVVKIQTSDIINLQEYADFRKKSEAKISNEGLHEIDNPAEKIKEKNAGIKNGARTPEQAGSLHVKKRSKMWRNLKETVLYKRANYSFELFGLKATRLVLRLPDLGGLKHPVHVHMVAPPGTMIDDVQLLNEDGGIPAPPREKVGLFFHHQRALLFDRKLPAAQYRMLIKINPKRGVFLSPASAALVMQLIIFAGLIIAGPMRIARHDSAVISSLLLIPSLLTVLVSRDNEHELMSKMLAWQRGFTAAAGFSGVVCGLFLATLPEACELKSSWQTKAAFALLVGCLHFTLATLFLIIFQLTRISAMRGVVSIRKKKVELGGSYDESKVEESKARSRVYRRIAFWVIVAILAYSMSFKFAEAHLVSAWLDIPSHTPCPSP